MKNNNTPLTPEQQKQVAELVPHLNRTARALARNGQEYDDFRSAAYLAACVAVRTWDAKKESSLKTWVTRYVYTYITRERHFNAAPVKYSASTQRIIDHLHATAPAEFSIVALEQLATEKFPNAAIADTRDAAWVIGVPDQEFANFTYGRYSPGEAAGGKFVRPQVGTELVDLQTQIEVREWTNRFRHWLESLSPMMRATAQHFFVDGLTQSEIAGIYQVSREAVRQRIERLKKSWHGATKNETEKKNADCNHGQ